MKKIFNPLATFFCVIFISGALLVSGGVFAQKPVVVQRSNSFLGSYLAGRYASSKHDVIVAAHYMRRALDYDPSNKRILEQSFLLELMGGDWTRASTLSKQLITIDPAHPFARLFRGVDEFNGQKYSLAEAHFLAGSDGPLGALIAKVAQAWIYSEQGEYAKAMKLLAEKSATDWVRDYQQYHRALIADVNGKTKDAQQAYSRLFRKYHQMVRLVGSYAQFLAKNGQRQAALTVISKHFQKSRFKHPDLEQIEAKIKAKIPMVAHVQTAQEGLAEIFFSLGDRRAENGGTEDGFIFLQMARLLRPNFAAADYSLASLLFRVKKYDRAIVYLGGIQEIQPIWLDAQILKAQALSAKDETKTAIQILEALVKKTELEKPEVVIEKITSPVKDDENLNSEKTKAQTYVVKDGDNLWIIAKNILGNGQLHTEISRLNPELSDGTNKVRPGQILIVKEAGSKNKISNIQKPVLKVAKSIEKTPAPVGDIDLFNALGKLYLDEKKYSNAVSNYSKAISLLKKPRQSDWFYYYGRGISYERLKEWPKAELDFQRALKLSPNRPDVLNYLGYSWVDQNLNLSNAMKLIRKAVKLRPTSGYYVDSLGWAHYRLGKYKAAVSILEKAVMLRPDDPVINDHLGDVYWRVGRKNEAYFQWKQVLSLKPDAELIEQINKKLADGLSEKRQAKAAILKD